MVKEIRTEKEFNEMIKSDIVIIDFWAEWCMPCVALAPVMESLEKKFKNIRFAKANVDDNAELAEKFSISSIPTLIIFKKGKLYGKLIGSRPEEELEKLFKKIR